MYTNKLINLIFPFQKHDINYYEKLYTKRENDLIVRFAPSPTGFLHTGSLYTALINYKLAFDNKGIFYLRIEDTDSKRTVSGSMEGFKKELAYFGLNYENDDRYGPYMQSMRKDIYNACIIKLLESGDAYPCFLSEDEISLIRKYQDENKLRTGIYKEYAKYRNISEDEACKLISEGKPYVIRLKSTGDFNEKFIFNDRLHGDILLPSNDHDVVILKGDGLPTYHFAHAVDDHFMGTTDVIRGEEWLTSAPIHVELFCKLGFELPRYTHLDSILKLDNGNKRKLSKRYDEEASVSYLIKQGYPKEAIINYLLTLANSNYEEYFLSSKDNNISNFKLTFDKMPRSGALFDIVKLNSISKETISYMDNTSFANSVYEWAKENDLSLFNLIEKDFNKFKSILSIGRNGINPRKEYERYDQIYSKIKFFYNHEFLKMNFDIPYDLDVVFEVVNSFMEVDFTIDEETWLTLIKQKASQLGFAKNKKEMELNGLKYIFADYMKIIRILICKSDQSPSIYDVINILGKEEVYNRLTRR